MTNASVLPAPAAPRLKEWLVADSERWVLWYPVFLALGIAGFFALPGLPPRWWSGSAGVLSLAAVLLAWRLPAFRLGFAGVALVAAGFALAHGRTVLIASPMISGPLEALPIRAVLLDRHMQERGERLYLSPLQLGGMGESILLPQRLRVKTMARERDFQVGDTLRFSANLFPLPQPAIPGGPDFARQWYFERIGATGYTISRIETELRDETPAGLTQLLIRWRVALVAKLRELLPPTQAPIAIALIAGEQGSIPRDVADAMRVSGLTHILSISGFHVAVVAGASLWLVRLLLSLVPALALRVNTKKPAAVAAAFIALAYVLISGAQVPAVRAYAMTLLVLLAVMLDRRALTLRNLALAALLLLFLWPESLLGVSFHLSFAATIALVAWMEGPARRPWFQGLPHWLAKPARYLGGVLLTTVLATVATLPLTVYHFNNVPLYSMVANGLAVPLASLFILPVAMVAMLLLPLGMGEGLLRLSGIGMEWMVEITQWVAGLPQAVVLLPAPAGWAPLCCALGALWLIIWRTPLRWLGCIPVVIGAIGFITATPPAAVMNAKQGMLKLDDHRVLWVAPRRTRSGFLSDLWQRRLNATEVVRWRAGEVPSGLNCMNGACTLLHDARIGVLLPDTAPDAPCPSVTLLLDFANRQDCTAQTILRQAMLGRYEVALITPKGEKWQHRTTANQAHEAWPWRAARAGNEDDE